jgi:hypothetical protein
MSINWRMNVVNGPLYGLMLTEDYFNGYMASNILCNIFSRFVTFVVLLSVRECFPGLASAQDHTYKLLEELYSETCIRRNRMGPKIFSTLDKFPHYTK